MKRSPLIILFITVMIDLLGFGIVFPLLPVYVTKFGGTPVIAGWFGASFSIMQFIFSATLYSRYSCYSTSQPVPTIPLLAG